MNAFFTLALILQFLIEILVGVLMVTSPESGAPNATLNELFQLRNQGFIAISIGLATLMLWFQRKSAAVICYATGFFVVYHTLVSVSGAINSTMGFNFLPMLVHVLLAGVFLIIWGNRNSLEF